MALVGACRYGFVEFRAEEDADYAIKIMNMIKAPAHQPHRSSPCTDAKKTVLRRRPKVFRPHRCVALQRSSESRFESTKHPATRRPSM